MGKEKMREEFEAWAATHYLLMELSTAFEDGEYVEPEMQYASEAWQASREALVIELPGSCGWDGYDGGELFIKKKVIEAIEAAGVKVKP